MPSDLLFDKTDEEVLSQHLWDLKQPIADQIQKDFAIDVGANADSKTNRSGNRQSAFFKCRHVLIRSKTATYAEQQQGMYVLMRGCAAAFLLACSFYLGLAVGRIYRYESPPSADPRLGLLACFLIALLFAFASLALQRRPSIDERQARAVVFWMTLVAFGFAGLIAGRQEQTTDSIVSVPSRVEQALSEEKDPIKFADGQRALDKWEARQQIQSHQVALLFASAAATALLAPLCLAAYRGFAVTFAVTVYRDYYRSSVKTPPTGAATKGS